MARFFTMEGIGGRRRSVAETGGAELCVCSYLGPGGGAVDLLDSRGALLASLRGGTMAVRDFHARMAGGERIRVYGAAPLLTVESDRRARTEVAVAAEAGGWRCLTWRRDGGIAGVLRLRPLDGAVPWTFDVPAWEDPLRALAVLHAAERLLREIEAAAAEGA